MTTGDRTEIGGPDDRFRTTHWTQVLRAGTADEARRRQALGEILARYWKPVYSYLRRKGHDNERAKDLTQGFFQEVVLGRQLVQKADRAKGRLRTFLLTALDRYVTSVHRAETAKKREPEGGVLSLEGIGSVRVPEPVHDATPDAAYNYAWASTLLDDVLRELADEWCVGGKEAHWQVFRARVLRPIMENAEAPSLTELCERHGIESESKASNMIVTVKRRFRAILKRCIGECVDSEDQVDQEIGELIENLCGGHAGS